MRPDDLFTPEELNLIQRLQHAPQPTLRADAFGSIQSQLLEEVGIRSDRQIPSKPGQLITRPILFVIGIVVIAILLALSVLLASQMKVNEQTPQRTQPAAPTEAASPTNTNLAVATQPPTMALTETDPQQTEAAPIAASTEATPQTNVIAIIEGPVQKISNNVVAIFDTEIQIDPDDPILPLVQVGKTLRVEGYSDTSGGTIIFIAVNVSIINHVTVVGTGLPPGCKVSKKGTIKCSKKKK